MRNIWEITYQASDSVSARKKIQATVTRMKVRTVLAQIPAADLTHAISVIMLIGGFIGIAAVLCTIELPKRAHAKEER